MSRKHARSDDDEEEELYDNSGKRVKLDTLLQNLSIDEDDDKDKHVKAEYHINPNILLSNQKTDSYTYSNLTSKLNGIIADHFKDVLHAGLQVIPWYNSKFLIIYHYRQWFVKLFNRFIKQYNEKHHTSIKNFPTCEKILQLVKDNMLTLQELKNIIAQENNLELQRLQLKQEMRRSNKRFEELSSERNAYKDLSYNYWDNLKFDKDLDMLDSSDDELDGSKVEDIPID
ncbi:hypothetical protein SBY92_004088 [Candida maltosa Xu316]|uniref:Uncharacterized protein n=1 Tax=Candida maltosa (strain Xu316) TaxID=1245528 RepID=M3IQL2_CANMX|nr:hypothetical protein G210_0607 [Candida maltosa Xu316]